MQDQKPKLKIQHPLSQSSCDHYADLDVIADNVPNLDLTKTSSIANPFDNDNNTREDVTCEVDDKLDVSSASSFNVYNNLRAKARKKLCKSLPSIPDKLYFSIGEVSKLCLLKPHVLRYWEQEFSQLKPSKRRGNRRYYQKKDIEALRAIKDLLYNQGFTIEGARNKLNRGYLSVRKKVAAPPIQNTVIENDKVLAAVASQVTSTIDSVGNEHKKLLKELLSSLEDTLDKLQD